MHVCSNILCKPGSMTVDDDDDNKCTLHNRLIMLTEPIT